MDHDAASGEARNPTHPRMEPWAAGERAVVSVEGLQGLMRALREDGYQLIGPTVRDGAIVHAEIQGIEDLPAGWTEVQEASTYRMKRRDDGALFEYSVGPQSWKQLFFLPRLRLFQAHRKDGGFVVDAEPSQPPRLALIGARSCDLHAIEVQDRTFLRGSFVDPDYAARREGVFVVAVNCGQAGGTCFCVILVSGDVGRHGIAVLSVREGVAFETPVESDCTPLTPLVHALLEEGLSLHCLRDLTRGGLATVLNEIALDAGVGVEVEETATPVVDGVAGACEMLGLDPFYVACEGRMAVFLPEAEADRALALLRAHPLGLGASRIGRVGDGPRGMVTLKTRLGGRRLLDLLSGKQLPRIC